MRSESVQVSGRSPQRLAGDHGDTAAEGVTELYAAHAPGLMRLALIMVGDRPSAEDVVQDAFIGLYRRWRTLTDTDKAINYVRASVLNGARTVLRQRYRQVLPPGPAASAESAEALALVSEEHREVLAAMRRLPDRQREALVLRYYLDLGEQDTATAMGVSRGTVKSTTSRALAALGKMLGDAR